jgi:hypothetical protein
MEKREFPENDDETVITLQIHSINDYPGLKTHQTPYAWASGSLEFCIPSTIFLVYQ